MKKIAKFLIVSLGLTSTATYAEDLMQVFEQSLKSDPQLLAERASVNAVAELGDQAIARFLPQLGVSANTGQVRRDSSAQIFGGSQEYNSHGYSLNLTQPVYRRQNFVQSEQADIALESAQAGYQEAEQSLIVRVAERYFDLLAKQDDLGFAQAETEANAKQLEQVKLRFELGAATITDLTESQAGYDLAVASEITAENELANSQERIRETAGVYFEYLAGLKADSPLITPEPADNQQWADKALEQNPGLMVAVKAKEDAKQTIELERSGHFPSLDIVGQKSYASQSDSGFGGSSKTHQDTLSLQLNMPLFEGGATASKTREASHRLDQAMQNEEQKRREVIRQTREAFNSVMSGISRVKALKQAVISSEKALESTEAGYSVGTRTAVDVLNSRRDLFSAKRDYADSRYAYILSSLQLKQAAGILSVDDLAQINQWLETGSDE